MSDRVGGTAGGGAATLLRVVLLTLVPLLSASVVLGVGLLVDDPDTTRQLRHVLIAVALVGYTAVLLLRAARSAPDERPAWLVAGTVAPAAGVVALAGTHGAYGAGALARGAVCLLLLVAVALLPGVRRGSDRALMLVLDGWALAAGPFVVLLVAGDASGLLPRSDGPLGAEVPLVGVWLLLDLLVLALFAGLMRRAVKGRRRALAPFAVSMAAATLADTLTWRGGLDGPVDVFSDAAWTLAVVTAALGALGATTPLFAPDPAFAPPTRSRTQHTRTRASDGGPSSLVDESGTWLPALVAGGVATVLAVRGISSGRVQPELAIVVLTLIAAVITQVALLLRSQGRLARRLQETSTRYRTIVDGSTDVVFVCDADGVARFVSPASRSVLGLEPSELEGRELTGLAHAADRADLEGALRRARTVGARVVEVVDQVRVSRAGGGWRHVELRVQPHDTAAVPGGLTLVMRDVSERVRMQRELERRARLDALTGLPNRWWFGRTLAGRLDQGLPTAVVFIDLDEFKAVNDTEGHAVGDRLLVAAARRLRFAVGEEDVVGRLSGDEFAVVVGDDDVEQVRQLAQRVLEEVAAPYAVGTRRVRIAASIGLAVAKPGEDADTVLRDADLAMYEAKRSGGHRVAVSHPSMLQAVVDRTELDRRVRAAAAEDDFELVYQALVDLSDGRVVGAEALLRWPGSGVAPSEFVPRLEQAGLIVDVGGLMLTRAVTQAARWWRDGRSTGISVNLSPLQLGDGQLVERVRAVLDSTGLPADRLTLEVTESLLLRDLDAAVDLLQQLRATGVHVALDDFGTGYSSLAYLHRLPIDVLKVDRSFVTAAAASHRDLVVLRSIIGLGQELGLSVVAEGVQDVAQVELLLGLGCTVAQGFLLASPARAEDVPLSVAVPSSGDLVVLPGLVGMRDDVSLGETEARRS